MAQSHRWCGPMYQLFRVGGAETNYRLTIGQAHGVGSTFDAMVYQNGRPFSTPDHDNDAVGGKNCAIVATWWWLVVQCQPSETAL